MRKSSRVSSKILNQAVRNVPKGSKRTRESSGSSNGHDLQTHVEIPATKRPKIEPKSPTKIPQNKTKPTKVECKDEGLSPAKIKPRKRTRKVEPEASSAKFTAKVQKVKAEGPEGRKFIGAHVSISGGLYNAVYSAKEIGARAFAMFLRSQRQWNSKPLEDHVAQRFREACVAEGFSPKYILPHGIYLMNCGSPDLETLAKSRDVLVEELQRCEKLGLSLYNFHPGSTCGKISIDECLDRIGESINIAHGKTKSVVTVIENMSCQGNTIGGKFEEIRGIIDRVKDKSRVGTCLDTCHAFAAGYNISRKDEYERVMKEFDDIIGFQYLKGVHLNDSKGELGCHLDRHENIGKGKIGKEGFRLFMEDRRFDGIPMILETPCVSDSTYSREIKALYSMVK